MRACGPCTLCCTLLPISELQKHSGVRCKHQRFRTGCVIHAKREMPISCRVWSCRWLLGVDDELRRPDVGHYAVDITPDFVIVGDAETGTKEPVIQILVDPRFPDAHQDAGLRAFVDRVARSKGQAAIIRYNESDAFLLVAPCLSSSGKWEEMRSVKVGAVHSPAEIMEVHRAHAERAQ